MTILQVKILKADIIAAIGGAVPYAAAGGAFSGVNIKKAINVGKSAQMGMKLAGFTWVDTKGVSTDPENNYIVNLFSNNFVYNNGNQYLSFSNKQEKVNPSASGPYDYYFNLASSQVDLTLFLEILDAAGAVDKNKSWTDAGFLYCILSFELKDGICKE